MNITYRPNADLKEDIRAYWSERSKTFDQDFGHRIPEGPEFDAWAKAIRAQLGDKPLKILELACGTGEVTRVLLSMGHTVTALDFSEPMLATAKVKHQGNARAYFILADAENTMEPDESYDAIVSRHLVWTLTDPAMAFADWHRVLRPDGKLLFFDGNWAEPSRLGRLALRIIAVMDRVTGASTHLDGGLGARHTEIMQRLPFSNGLSPSAVVPLLDRAGFADIEVTSQRSIARGQRDRANIRNKLRTLVYNKFVLSCTKSA
jgi:ubiquinone/menaquinone biosynthesis C-methylase UbiE